MAFIDQLIIKVAAGKGGDGVVRWRHEKYREFAGPSGGNGGNGGDVWAVGVRDVMYLSKYQRGQLFEAEAGEDGRKNSQFGKNGEDLEIMIPVGCVLTNLDDSSQYEIVHEGQRVLLAKGGRGGLGNEHFKGSRNRAPEESTPGTEGVQAKYQVELRLFADAGFIGFPNAGKSSLLNALTNATSKVGNYEFTTLDPSLGAFHGYILADIPGLIEGASEGRGLGHKFLRHITRTRFLLHCISLEREDLAHDYQVIRNELESYSEELAKKKEIVILTKTDMLENQELLADKIEQLGEVTDSEIITVSILDDDSLKDLGSTLSKALKDCE